MLYLFQVLNGIGIGMIASLRGGTAPGRSGFGARFMQRILPTAR